MYGLLSGLLKNRPLLLLKPIPDSNGLEAVRELIATLQPPNTNRTLALLNNIMQRGTLNMRESLLGQILKLEDAFREHDRISSPLSETIKVAILSRSVSGQLRTYKQVHLSETSSYNELREAILKWDRATVRWDKKGAFASSSMDQHATQDPDQMEIDRVQKGKGKWEKEKTQKGKEKAKKERQVHRRRQSTAVTAIQQLKAELATTTSEGTR